LWLSGSAVYLHAQWPARWQSDPIVREAKPKGAFGDLIRKKNERNVFDQFDPNPVREHLISVARFAFIPPIALFALGWTCLWVGRGFKLVFGYG
jgi:hypothetical protein